MTDFSLSSLLLDNFNNPIFYSHLQQCTTPSINSAILQRSVNFLLSSSCRFKLNSIIFYTTLNDTLESLPNDSKPIKRKVNTINTILFNWQNPNRFLRTNKSTLWYTVHDHYRKYSHCFSFFKEQILSSNFLKFLYSFLLRQKYFLSTSSCDWHVRLLNILIVYARYFWKQLLR